MMKAYSALVAIISVLAATIALGCWRSRSAHELALTRDVPIALAANPIRVPLGNHWTIVFNFFLEGDIEELSILPADERELVLDFVRELVVETNFALRHKANDEEFLFDVVSRINALLGDDVVTGVRFAEVSFEEKGFR